MEMHSAVKDVGSGRYKTRHHQRRQIINKTWDLVQKIIVPNLKLKTHHNCKYSYNDFFKLLTYAGINNSFAEGSSNSLNLYSNKECPNGDTLLYHLKKFDEDELRASYEVVIDQIITMGKQSGFLKGSVDVAIDFTDDLYYGDKNDPMVVGTKPQRGTSRAYRYATLTIVEKNCKFTIKAIPVDKSTSKSEIVYKLLQYAKERIKINNVYLDRGFYSVDVVSTLNALGINYAMPAVQNEKMRKVMRGKEPPKIIDYIIGSDEKRTLTKLVILFDSNGEKRPFITNIDVNRRKTRELLHHYSKRWVIETSYRVRKEFRPRTTSKNYIIRLFYFLFSVCLYNLWQLVKMILFTIVEYGNQKILSITAKELGWVVFFMFEGSSTGPPSKFGRLKNLRD